MLLLACALGIVLYLWSLSFFFEPLFILFERIGEIKKSIGILYGAPAILYDYTTNFHLLVQSKLPSSWGCFWVMHLFKYWNSFCLFVACSLELHSVPFLSSVQIFFHSPLGEFINSVNIMGGNLENSVMRNCGYYHYFGGFIYSTL